MCSHAGYLPAYWIKIRLLSMPAVATTGLATVWPQALGGLTHVTVGLVATFTSIACVVAADVGAYFVGVLALSPFGTPPVFFCFFLWL